MHIPDEHVIVAVLAMLGSLLFLASIWVLGKAMTRPAPRARRSSWSDDQWSPGDDYAR